jgi:hypothetical protein
VAEQKIHVETRQSDHIDTQRSELLTMRGAVDCREPP